LTDGPKKYPEAIANAKNSFSIYEEYKGGKVGKFGKMAKLL